MKSQNHRDVHKLIRIEIHKDKKMFVSEWAIFLLGSAFVLIVIFSIMDVIKDFPESQKLLALIVFMFTIMKIFFWIKVPTTFSTNDITSELDYYFKEEIHK